MIKISAKWAVEEWLHDLAICPITKFTMDDIVKDLGVERGEISKCLDDAHLSDKIHCYGEDYEITQTYKDHRRRQESKKKFWRKVNKS